MASTIRVNTNWYENTWGRKPRGRGGWWFKIDGEDFQFNGLYSEAVRQARRKARELGAFEIVVLP